MSTEYQPGDIVDVEIKGAKVIGIDANDDGVYQIGIAYGSDDVNFQSHSDIWIGGMDGVTVTRRTPQPKAGEVWELTDGTQLHIIANSQGSLMTVNGFTREYRLPDKVDFTSARKVYPVDAGTVTR